MAYEPKSLSDNSPRETPAKGLRSAAATETGEKGRIRAESFAGHYSQARQFCLSQTAYEQSHIASALVFELSKVEHVHVGEAMVGHLRHSEEDLAKRVAAGLAMGTMAGRIMRVPDCASGPYDERAEDPSSVWVGSENVGSWFVG